MPHLKRVLRWLVALSLAFAAPAAATTPRLHYTVNLNDRADSVFKVSLRVSGLTAANAVFQFAATAPGTYQVMDIGRFVRRFAAYDARGREITTERVDTNQWRISQPARVREIRYAIGETNGSSLTVHRVYPMCGSALRADHALINGQAVFGFPSGMQAEAIDVRLLAPSDWVIGTPLQRRGAVYQADSYDRLVDSPILLGPLTRSSLLVTGVPVEIYTYSAGSQITSAQLLESMRAMLLAAGSFLGRLPVDRYTFLYYFGPQSFGAWEHSFGSEYVLQNVPFTPRVGKRVTDIAAHEFFHVVTPLNLHSEIIEHFNFVTPVPSQHLWLYEGTTEWAAQKMQLESGLETAEDYLITVAQKFRTDRGNYDSTWSLSELALTSFSDSGQRQYGNIYQRGAVVAGLLDIRLLELSDGQHGLRDLIGELTSVYGKRRAFPEDSLFAIMAQRTAPEVTDFVRRYIQGAEHPPLREYYAKLGFTEVDDDRGLPLRFQPDSNATARQLALRSAWLGPHGILGQPAARAQPVP
jgi:predicted metalloprotease with PDZ domain